MRQQQRNWNFTVGISVLSRQTSIVSLYISNECIRMHESQRELHPRGVCVINLTNHLQVSALFVLQNVFSFVWGVAVLCLSLSLSQWHSSTAKESLWGTIKVAKAPTVWWKFNTKAFPPCFVCLHIGRYHTRPRKMKRQRNIAKWAKEPFVNCTANRKNKRKTKSNAN